MRKLLLTLLLLGASGALAQDIPNHSVPIGGGQGAVGWKSVGPCAANQGLRWSSTSADPTCNTTGGMTGFVDVGALGCAVADNVTDNTTCIQNAINALEATYAAGIVYIPAGNGAAYCVNGGLVLHNPGMRIVGASKYYSFLATCTGNTAPVVKMQGTMQSLEHIQIFGANAPGRTGALGPPIYGASFPAVHITSAAVYVHLYDVYITGGLHAVLDEGNDNTYDLVYAAYGYSVAAVNAKGSGWWKRVSYDQIYPLAFPSVATIAAWAPATVYGTPGVIVTHPSGIYMQLITAGTSGGAAPTLQNYFVNMPDNTAVWQLVAPTGYSGVSFNSASATEYYISQMDASGPFEHSLTVNGANVFLKCHQCLVSGGLSGNMLISSATDVQISDMHTGIVAQPTQSSIQTGAGFVGKLSITNSTLEGATTGITWGGNVTAKLLVSNSFIGSAGTTGITIPVGSANIVINGNFIRASSVGVNVLAGATNFYNIVNNICGGGGTCVTDGGTGVNKTVSGNN